MINQYWFSKWLGVVGQQASTWGNDDHDLCRHMTSLDHNEFRLKYEGRLWGGIIGYSNKRNFGKIAHHQIGKWF